MMKRSIVALLLCLTLLWSCGLLASCGSRDTPEAQGTGDGTAASAEGTGAETEKSVPERDVVNCNGEVFTILAQSEEGNGWTGIPDDIYVDTDTGDVLESAVFSRNQRIETDFSVRIAEQLETKPGEKIRTVAQSGDDLYGLLVLAAKTLNTFVEGGYAYELNSLGLDSSSAWFDQYVRRTLTIKGKLYCVASDMTYMDKLATVATFFNKEMTANFNVPDLYQLSVSGGWTFEKMLEFGRLAARDTENDGQRGTGDVYALSGQNDSVYYLVHSMGAVFASMDNNGAIVCNLFDELFEERLQKVYDLMLDSTVFINRQTGSTKMTTEEVASHFSEGQAMFLIRPIQSMYDLRHYRMEFGIIPTPKENESQEKYYSSVNFYAAGMTMIPTTVRDTERSLAIMDYMAADSHDTVIPVLYNVVLDSKLSPDSNATKALDTIFSNRVFDIGLIWNFGDFRSTVVCKGLKNVASAVAALKTPVETGIQAMEARFKD